MTTAVCDSNPCLNNGTCSYSNHSDYTCTCPDGYQGLICQYSKL